MVSVSCQTPASVGINELPDIRNMKIHSKPDTLIELLNIIRASDDTIDVLILKKFLVRPQPEHHSHTAATPTDPQDFKKIERRRERGGASHNTINS